MRTAVMLGRMNGGGDGRAPPACIDAAGASEHQLRTVPLGLRATAAGAANEEPPAMRENKYDARRNRAARPSSSSARLPPQGLVLV